MPDSSDTSATGMQQECNTNERQRVTWVQHTCDMSPARTTRLRHKWKILILITTRVKTYFHTPILTICQMKDYLEKNNFISRTTFWKCLLPMLKCIWKVHHKKRALKLQKLYHISYKLDIAANPSVHSLIGTHSSAASFSIRLFYVKLTTCF